VEIIQKYKVTVSKLTNEEAAYLIGLGSLFVTPLLKYYAPFLSYWLFIGFFLSGAIIWFNIIVKRVSSLLIVKAFWSIVLISGTAFNLGLASINVNSILEVPSSPFIYTVTVTSVLLMPITLSVIGILLALPLIPVAILSSITQLKDFSPKRLLTFRFVTSFGKLSAVRFFGRIIACICLFAVCITFNKNSSWYLDIVEDRVKWFAYHLETEEFSYCKLGANERVAYLSSGKIVIASKSSESYIFRVGLCETAL
jgi:hypothetical protein